MVYKNNLYEYSGDEGHSEKKKSDNSLLWFYLFMVFGAILNKILGFHGTEVDFYNSKMSGYATQPLESGIAGHFPLATVIFISVICVSYILVRKLRKIKEDKFWGIY